MRRSEEGNRKGPRNSGSGSSEESKSPQGSAGEGAMPCWPFPVGSQNETDKAVKLKPYVPPKRRTLNQY
jgi:hypothetical protein